MTEGTGKGAGTGPPRTEEEQRPPSKEVAPESEEVPMTERERDRVKEHKQEADKGLIDKVKDKLRGQ